MSSEHVPVRVPWSTWLEFDIQALLKATRSERLIHFIPYLIVPLLLLAYVLAVSRSLNRLPNSLPWMDRRPGEAFSAFRACLRQFGAGFGGLREASEEYGKRGLSFVFPLPSFRPVVILPMEHLRWLLKQPDHVLSQRDALSEHSGMPDVLPSLCVPDMGKLGGFMINTLKFNSQYKVNHHQESLLDEIRPVINSTLGYDTESWKKIHLSALMNKITSHTGARVITDKSLSQDENFTNACDRFSFWFGIMHFVIGSYSPPVIRTILSYLLRFPLAYVFDRCVKSIMPLLEERWDYIQNFHEDAISPDKPREDLMTWAITASLAGKYQDLGTPKRIAEMLMLFSLAASGTSAMTSTHVLLDLLLSERENYDQVQAEAIATFNAYEKGSSGSLLAKLTCADSAIRESMRHHPLFVPFPVMKVMQEGGLTLPTGEQMPYGTFIGTPIFRVHMDPDTYPEPEKYQPFRFLRASPSTVPTGKGGDEGRAQSFETEVSATAATDSFLSFGAGRHTCPGRWIAAAQIKLILAYTLAHYDIKPLAERPASRRFGQAEVPSLSATIEVRRRKGV